MTEKLAANCPKCRAEMIYVTHLPHAQARHMQRTTFVCYSCNRTRSYMLSAEMAAAYAGTGASTVEAT